MPVGTWPRAVTISIVALCVAAVFIVGSITDSVREAAKHSVAVTVFGNVTCLHEPTRVPTISCCTETQK
jgi:hypothetical protein